MRHAAFRILFCDTRLIDNYGGLGRRRFQPARSRDRLRRLAISNPRMCAASLQGSQHGKGRVRVGR